MKTLSEFLYTKYKQQLPELIGVAKATISIDILELPVFDRSGYIQAVAGSPILSVQAEFYSVNEWRNCVLEDVGSLKIVSTEKLEYPIYPRTLVVGWRAKPGAETIELLETLKEVFK